MKIETFTLRSNDTGGVAALRQVSGLWRTEYLNFLVNAPEGT
ncbi:MAG: hypothetical protein ACLU30_20360 [Odoribacter splanchnicus]